MKTRRKFLVAAGTSVLAAPFVSFAQQPQARIVRIGFLGSESAGGYASRIEALRAGLRDHGYIEGKNMVLEFRWAEGNVDRLPDLAAELLRLKLDVLVTHGSSGSLAAKRATTTTPIVFATNGDVVGLGLVSSLARPGGNITGSVFFQNELFAKRLELLKETLPRVTQLGFLLHPDYPSNGPLLEAAPKMATTLKVELQRFDAREPGDFEAVFSAMSRQRIGALATYEGPVFLANAGLLASLAIKHRIVSSGGVEYAEAGGMIGYGANLLALYRRVGYFVDKIVKGTNPGEIPIEQATRFELIVNQKTARMIGVKVPQSIIARADREIA